MNSPAPELRVNSRRFDFDSRFLETKTDGFRSKEWMTSDGGVRRRCFINNVAAAIYHSSLRNFCVSFTEERTRRSGSKRFEGSCRTQICRRCKVELGRSRLQERVNAFEWHPGESVCHKLFIALRNDHLVRK